MAILVRMVMTVTVVVRVIVVATTVAVLVVVLVVRTVTMAFSAVLFIGHASFDMYMGSLVSRVTVPQGEAKPRYRSRVQPQSVCRMERAECSLPAKSLLRERFHLRLPNDRQANVGDVTDPPESPTTPGSENAMAGATDIRTVPG